MSAVISANPSPLASSSTDSVQQSWADSLRSRVAGLDLKFALVFLAVYYIRPQDWVPGMAGFNIIRPIMIGWFLVLASQGSKSPVQGWFRTPHDWAILLFGVYVVWTAPPGIGALNAMFSLSIFYYLSCHALATWDGIVTYLKAWNICLLCLAAFGVLQTFGLDITEGRHYTEFFLGRLSLGTWMTNNPNALGHTVILAIPLSYILYFWRGTGVGRVIIFPLNVALVGWCAWKTESKGAFLVGAGLTVMLFVVGRPRWVKITVIAAALTLGVGALSFLPRMEQMGNLRADDGVQGRLMAWMLAKGAMENNTFGVGWKQFVAIFPWREGRKVVTVYKATHSSYVQVGADLGVYGLALWLLALWVALRTAAFFKSLDDQQERCRRALMLLLVGYLASGWMINRQYHTEYFLIIAIAAAIHRLGLARHLETPAGVPRLLWDAPPGTSQTPDSAETLGANRTPPWQPPVPEDLAPDAEGDEPGKLRRFWNSIGLADLAAMIALTWGVIYIWDYILNNL